MEIRNTTTADLERVMEIYAYARAFMAAHGNPNQWGARGWPPRELIEKDIERKKSYVCIEDNHIAAVFYYDFGPHIERCYDTIHDGEWLQDSPYGVVHRIASSGECKGAASFCINWALEQSKHLRIDTHGDNYVMQNLLKKLGFTHCGTIFVEEDNDPRLAFEKLL